MKRNKTINIGDYSFQVSKNRLVQVSRYSGNRVPGGLKVSKKQVQQVKALIDARPLNLAGHDVQPNVKGVQIGCTMVTKKQVESVLKRMSR